MIEWLNGYRNSTLAPLLRKKTTEIIFSFFTGMLTISKTLSDQKIIIKFVKKGIIIFVNYVFFGNLIVKKHIVKANK